MGFNVLDLEGSPRGRGVAPWGGEGKEEGKEDEKEEGKEEGKEKGEGKVAGKE